MKKDKAGSPAKPTRSVEKVGKSGVRSFSGSCQMLTNLPGQFCPLCNAEITANIPHSCSIEGK